MLFFRDTKSEGQFHDVGKFFICVDVCEDGFNGKRIAFIVPMVLMGNHSNGLHTFLFLYFYFFQLFLLSPRLLFFFYFVHLGIIVVASLLCCCFCKRCYIYRMRKNRQKDSALLSETSSTTSSAASLQKTRSVNSMNSVETSEKVHKNWGGLYTVSAKMSSKVGDINNR